jgi:hypothetical protein
MCLGLPVSSVEGVTPDESFGEVGRRSRRAHRVVALVYLGIPLVFLALVLWISASADTDSFNWQAGLLPLGLLVIGWFVRKKHRYKPARWGGSGLWLGAITAFFSSFYTILLDLDWLATLFLPAAVLGGIIGMALGRYAERVLMVPALPELAESPYELSFRLRGLTRVRIVIGASEVTVCETVRVRTAEGPRTNEKGRTYPFADVTGVHDVTLSGAERLRYPITLRTAPASTPGPAVILQAQGADWVLPHNEAPAITQILNRRIAAARQRK